jgi:hypothetical protein
LLSVSSVSPELSGLTELTDSNSAYAEAYEECKNSCGDSHLPDGLDDPLADLDLDKSVGRR